MAGPKAIVTLSAALALGGCGFSESRLNPFNWFGSDTAQTSAEPIVVERRADPRPLVPQITQLAVDRTPGGAIIRVTGLTPQQGWYAAALVPEPGGAGASPSVLTYSFRALPPRTPTRVSTPRSREITAAVFVSDIALAPIRQIRVTGALNSRTARR